MADKKQKTKEMRIATTTTTTTERTTETVIAAKVTTMRILIDRLRQQVSEHRSHNRAWAPSPSLGFFVVV